jgi:hypothetical protein
MVHCSIWQQDIRRYCGFGLGIAGAGLGAIGFGLGIAGVGLGAIGFGMGAFGLRSQKSSNARGFCVGARDGFLLGIKFGMQPKESNCLSCD